ncbi:MAG: oxalate/formate MFS antiporter, partial [Paraburkholderia nemoris]
MDDITRQTTTRVFWANRWWQLVIGMMCMALVANLQYAWTLFVTPMNSRHHW